MEDESLTYAIIGCCFEVMNELGPGFLESVYQNALFIALRTKGMECKVKVPLRVSFRGEPVGIFEADLLVENKVIVELKVAKALAPEHQAQLLNYLKATGVQTGLLVNFGNGKIETKRAYLNHGPDRLA